MIEKDYAYESEGDVYFAVSKATDYGKLSNRSIDDEVEKESIGSKKHPSDFALWKKAKSAEPFWPSPWGDGRPGWHIECSVMAHKYLGETLDINGGGLDLVFPHHENEIIQSESFSGKLFARYWIHNGLVMVDGQKMSKSLRNFYTIKETLTRFTPDIIRYLVLSHHYSSHIDFLESSFRDAEKRILYFYKTLDQIKRFLHENATDGQDALHSSKTALGLINNFTKVMDENFNTAKVIADLSDAFSKTNDLLTNQSIPSAAKIPVIRQFSSEVSEITKVFRLFDEEPEETVRLHSERALKRSGLTVDYVTKEIERRSAARKRKDYALADQIRENLKKRGIRLMDNADRTEWEIII